MYLIAAILQGTTRWRGQMIYHEIPAIPDCNINLLLATFPLQMKTHPPCHYPILRHWMVAV